MVQQSFFKNALKSKPKAVEATPHKNQDNNSRHIELPLLTLKTKDHREGPRTSMRLKREVATPLSQ